MTDKLKGWSTEEELDYLMGLGTYRMGARQDPASVDPVYRLGMLLNYRKVFTCRTDWEEIDQGLVLVKLEALIARLECNEDLKKKGIKPPFED